MIILIYLDSYICTFFLNQVANLSLKIQLQIKLRFTLTLKLGTVS